MPELVTERTKDTLGSDDPARRALLRKLAAAGYATPAMLALLAARPAHASICLGNDCPPGGDETPPDEP